MGKITIDTSKAGAFEYGKDSSIESDVEAIFTLSPSGRATLHIKDDDFGYSKKIRLNTKKPDETDGLRLNTENVVIDNGQSSKKAYIPVVFIEE